MEALTLDLRNNDPIDSLFIFICYHYILVNKYLKIRGSFVSFQGFVRSLPDKVDFGGVEPPFRIYLQLIT